MQETIIEFLSERGTLIQPEALDYLTNLPDPLDRLKQGLRQGHEVPFVLTLDHARNLTSQHGTQDPPEPRRLPETETPTATPEEPPPRRRSSNPATKTPTNGTARTPDAAPPNPTDGFEQETKTITHDIKVELDITGESTCEGTIEDFTKLFRDRYNRMRRLFRRRREMVGAVTISNLAPGDDRKTIGLVKDVKTTKNGHRIIELEDDTGETVILAPKDEKRLIELSDTLLLDEVIGIVGKKLPDRGNKDGLLVMEELVRVDLRLDRERPQGTPGSAVFVSDVHLGSDTFLADPWDAFTEWVADNAAKGTDQAGIRHLVIAGDLVEGIGVYPGQEEELHIPEVYDQYQRAAETLARIPDDVNIIIQPGNHDTVVRLAEPQPALPPEIQGFFNDNVRFVGNPTRIGFDDVTLLAYHGVSLFDYFEALPPCNIDRPVQTMEEMLRRRHLCPPYGGKTPLAPEHEDHLVIDKEPDIFVTGHVHAARTGEYRGTRLINASTWQAQTDYQRMHGFNPDPCKAFQVDLQTLGVKTWDFENDHDAGTVETVDVSRTKIGAIQ